MCGMRERVCGHVRAHVWGSRALRVVGVVEYGPVGVSGRFAVRCVGA